MSDAITRLNAALEGRYAIERELGEGGMATVYLATDLKHNRNVALKVLKPELAAVVGAERFLAEIQVTANLQHPHILPLHDSGEAEGFLFYVMPYVEGETLRDRIDREKQLPVDEAVALASKVAGALHHAHEHGVIHRDIKPGNILLQDGEPVVADFGIALALGGAGSNRLTETGLSLGTPYYMSPEQATGDQAVGASTDTYALGSVLYEMLVGEPPYPGSTAQAVLGKIIVGEPVSATEHRPSVPANVDGAVRKALEKLPADRFTSAQEFAKALSDPGFRYGELVGAGVVAGTRTWNRLSQALAAVAIGLLIVVGFLVLRADPAPVQVSRFAIELMGAGGGNLAALYGREIAIADDGSRFAYLGAVGARSQILVRELPRLGAEPVRSTNDVVCCLAFSPDGESLAYIATPLELKVVSLRGGVARMVADSGLQEVSLYGGGVDWGPDGFLYVSMVDGIWRIAPDGDERERVTTIGTSERTHAWVDVLPNGKGALVTVIPRESGDLSTYAVGVVDFSTSEITLLFQGVYARYASSGHIVFVQDDGTMLAAPFDQDRLVATEAPVSLIDSVGVVGYGAVGMALSQTGTLIYRGEGRVIDRLVWVDRNAAVEGGVAPELDGVLLGPRLSPDGRRLAVDRATAEGRHVWTKSIGSADAVRHTFAGQVNGGVKWSRAGDAVYFISDRVDIASVFVKPVDGAGVPVRMSLPESRPIFGVVPIDEQTMLIRTDDQALGNGDILLVQIGVDTTVTSLLGTPARELTPAVSGDGQWLAYVSDESGANEVYVRAFPNVDAGVFRVSTDGGTEPVWAHSGRELFYRNGDGDLVVADVVATPTFSVTQQQILFSAIGYASNPFHTQYDVSLDDQRFLMILRNEGDVASEMVVVTNWFEELRQRMGN